MSITPTYIVHVITPQDTSSKKPVESLSILVCQAKFHTMEDLGTGYVKPILTDVVYQDGDTRKYLMVKPHSLILRYPDYSVLYSPRFYTSQLAKKWQRFLENQPDWPDKFIRGIGRYLQRQGEG